MRRRRYKARATLPPASPSKAPLFARHLLQSPASPYPLTPDFFFPPPPPARPAGPNGPVRWIRTQPQPSGPPKLARFFPAPPPWSTHHTRHLHLHGCSHNPSANLGRRCASADACLCPGFLLQRSVRIQRWAGGGGGEERAFAYLLYLPANPSPIAKINPSLCEPERASHHAGPRLCSGCKERRGLGGGVGSEPLPRRAGGASATWPRRGFAREAGAGGRSSWRRE